MLRPSTGAMDPTSKQSQKRMCFTSTHKVGRGHVVGICSELKKVNVGI